jgi:hypothetical protein
MAGRRAGLDRRAGEQHVHVPGRRSEVLGEAVGAGDAPVLQVERALDGELDAAGIDRELVRHRGHRQAVQGLQVLEVDAVGTAIQLSNAPRAPRTPRRTIAASSASGMRGTA